MPNTRNAGRKPKLSEEQFKEIKARREAGESVAVLAAEFGLSRQALNKRLVEERENIETRIDYMVDGQLCTSIYIDKKSTAIRLVNYAEALSKRAFGFNENPTWDDLCELVEDNYFKEKGVTDFNQLLCVDKEENISIDDSTSDLEQSKSESHLVIKEGSNVPRFEFSKSDRIVTRTSTDGFQLKAISKDRRHFVKSQAIISGTILKDWAVEIIASNICRQLDIPCVKQRQCQFVYEGRVFDGVYSDNFELDGYTFISFERLLERIGKSSKEEEFISLNAIEKIKWCARQLVNAGNVKYEEAEKYMLDMAVLDCLVGNIDRHTKNYGLFYNANTGKYEIPLVFDNGMGLFENDYYRDNYKTYDEAMNSVYVAPYGEDPFDMLRMLDDEYDLVKKYPGLLSFRYGKELNTPFALEYERRMLELCQK